MKKTLKKRKSAAGPIIIILLIIIALGVIVLCFPTPERNPSYVEPPVEPTTSQVVEEVKLEKISLSTKPSKLTYELYDTLSLEGGKVELSFSNGKKEYIALKDNMVANNVDMSKVGSRTVIVAINYNGDTMTVSYDINLVHTELGVTGIEFDSLLKAAYIGQTYKLDPVLTGEDVTVLDLFWSSSDESIATVNEEGLVTAVGYGDVIITAQSKKSREVTASTKIHILKFN